MDENEIRQLLGLDDEGDILGAISGLQGKITALEATLKTDAPEKGEVARLTTELDKASRRIIELDLEKNRDLLGLREEVHQMKATHKVDSAIARGRITPASREIALKVALGSKDEEFEAFVAQLPHIDMTERGSSRSELADFEPTAGEIEAAKVTGMWNAKDPAGSRAKIMAFKAQRAGVKIEQK